VRGCGAAELASAAVVAAALGSLPAVATCVLQVQGGASTTYVYIYLYLEAQCIETQHGDVEYIEVHRKIGVNVSVN